MTGKILAATCSITYLSQCIPLRHHNVGAENTYPFVAQRYVEAARPGVRATTSIIPYAYPYDGDLGFKFNLAARSRPDVIVLEVPASPLAHQGPMDLRRFPSYIRTTHQRLLYLRELNYRLQLAGPVGRLVNIADAALRAIIHGPLRSLVPRYPTPSPAEYESLVDATISRLVAKKAATLVLAGPAGFSDAGSGNGYVDGAPRLYDAVNDIVRRIAVRNRLPFVDRIAVASEGGSSFFDPGSSIHYSPTGHRLLGRLLGDQLVKLGIT